MVVRLVAKLADVVDGVDLSRFREGDLIEVPNRDAELLIAEGWAVRVHETLERSPRRSNARLHAIAADRGRRRR